MTEIKTAYNTGLAKVAVQCSADTFVVAESFVLSINICGGNRYLRQAQYVTSNPKTTESVTMNQQKKMPTAHLAHLVLPNTQVNAPSGIATLLTDKKENSQCLNKPLKI